MCDRPLSKMIVAFSMILDQPRLQCKMLHFLSGVTSSQILSTFAPTRLHHPLALNQPVDPPCSHRRSNECNPRRPSPTQHPKRDPATTLPVRACAFEHTRHLSITLQTPSHRLCAPHLNSVKANSSLFRCISGSSSTPKTPARQSCN